MYSIFKFFLFLLPPELAHSLTMSGLKICLKIPLVKYLFRFQKKEGLEFCGIHFPNRLGMAAGFDKNAAYISELVALGFGHIEIGTVTPLGQEGNPKPRLFRLKEDEAILNRMGFNNLGAEQVLENLKKHTQRDYIIGGNIGKNKRTPNEDAYLDYLICFEKLYDYVDYFVVNVSSPNTPNLRDLQDKDMLIQIFQTLQEYRKKQPASKPIFLKIAPDLSHEQLDEIIAVCELMKIDALIISNTTIDYEVLVKNKTFAIEQKMGGVSGKVLFEKSNEVISYIRSKSASIKMVGVGGIHDIASAQHKLDLGCDLIQIYTGFIYKGPKLVRKILNNIKKKEN